MNKPTQKPQNIKYSSGPCAKRPGWDAKIIENAVLGRSHRSGIGKAALKEVIDLHREILQIPDDYVIGITPGSNTGAFEMAMWSLLGERGVDLLSWESFSQDWAKDVIDQLAIKDVRQFAASYGELPDLSQVDCDRDVVFVWNGTTSGVVMPHADWVPSNRSGLTLCDATSAVFAYDLPWDKLDVTTWSWQKVLGGEAAHGMIVLSPRAVARLESYKPAWPMPKLFRMTKGGKLNDGIFRGETINTPSMMAVEDCLDALRWVKSLGGLSATIARSQENLDVMAKWVDQSSWVDFLAARPEIVSKTSLCLKLVDPWFMDLPEDQQSAFVKSVTKLLEQEAVALDINSYRAAPSGLRIWCGATIEASDLQILTQWLDWAFAKIKSQY